MSLNVIAADDGTELFVIDGAMRLRARGRGGLNTSLPPGVYTVRAAAGGQFDERMVVLRSGAPKPEEVSFPPLGFASPAPLEETATSHEYHQDFAEQESRTVHQKAGAGSWVFVMARTWRPAGSPPGARSNPAEGVVLRALDGREVFDFSRARFETYPDDPGRDVCAGGTVEVDPGLYLLERPGAGGERLTRTLTALAGWQTQAFLLRRPPDVEGGRPFVGTSVFLSDRRDAGAACPSFHRDNPDARLSELARLGLAGGRQVLSDRVVDEVVNGKFRDPMLGLFGAHLLLLTARTDEERKGLAPRLRVIVANLRGLFGGGHPDVEALALVLGDAAPFPVPPMLRRSWSLVVDATAGRPDLVPAGSLASAVADRVLADEPWLVWSVPAPVAKGGPGFEVLGPPEPDSPGEMLAAQLRPVGRGEFVAKGDPGSQHPDERQIRRLVRTLGLPRGRVEELLKTHFAKPLAAGPPAVPAGRGETQPAGGPVASRATANGDGWCFTWVPDRKASPGADKAALLKSVLWSPGDVLTVSFLDGDDEVIGKVMDHAREWTAPGLADLTLDFRRDPADGLIRISFRYPGSWSVLGTACKQITDRTRPTMNFGWLRRDTPDEQARRVVLHEFGHALGLIHEHHGPAGGIRWDRQAVIKDLSGPPNNWTAEQIELNLFRPFADAEVRVTPVDPESIMTYPIPARWTTDGFSVRLNTDLSPRDRRLIHEAYP